MISRSITARLLLAGLIAFAGLLQIASRADAPPRRRLILILADTIVLNDLDLGGGSRPNLEYIAKHGAVGLVNCAVWPTHTDEDALMAIAAGQVLPGKFSDEQAANDWEKAPGEIISAAESHRNRLLPRTLPIYSFDPLHSVKMLGIDQLRARGLDDGSRIGALLAAARPSVRTWIVGNADTSGWRRRAALLTVDSLGIGSGLVALRSFNPGLPYGLTDNPDAIADYALQTGAEFVVIQLGDGARAEAARSRLSGQAYRDAHAHAAAGLETLVSILRQRTNPAVDDLLIVSPRPLPTPGIRAGGTSSASWSDTDRTFRPALQHRLRPGRPRLSPISTSLRRSCGTFI